MEKHIGTHRKGNSNDGFGFISSSHHTNLFIHDKEFEEDIDAYDGENVLVTYKIRPSKFKKGSNEGYEGRTILAETDADFLFEFLNEKLNTAESKEISYDSFKICEALIVQLKKLNYNENKVIYFKEFFTDENIQTLINQKSEPRKFTLMKFGLNTFFPLEFENLNKRINEHQENELLKQMGYEGADKYDVLTDVFFNNFSQFEKFFYKFPKVVNKEFIYKIILESESLPFEESFESISRFVYVINGKRESDTDKYKLKRKRIKNRGENRYEELERRRRSDRQLENALVIDKEEAFRILSNLSTPKIRLYLWLNGLTEKFDFNEYKESIWLLEKEDQAFFVKKLFLWKSLGKINFTLQDLNEINVFNIEMFRAVKIKEPEKNYVNLDFNASLLVYILNSISNEDAFDNNKLFEYFLEYVSDNMIIQHIDFFYPECCGRTRGSRKAKINSETKEEVINSTTGLIEMEYSYYHQSSDKPLFHKFCDGQKDKENKLEYPADKPYYWCAGLPCFDPSNAKTISNENWEDWTIIEFLQILQIPYNVNKLSSLLGYINKANLLIDRLKCNSCNKLMSPVGENKLAYFLHSNFSCKDATCTEYNKVVYLNHCHNKNCGNIIDSRNSNKCTQIVNDNVYSGWYICECCYSCCSTEVINRIIEKRKAIGQNYNGTKVGHDELKAMFCYHCGDKMGLDIGFYKIQKEIITNLTKPNQNAFVEKAEENKGNWKFRLNFSTIRTDLRADGIKKLNNYGFKVTPSENNTQLYFIDRLISIAIKCNNSQCSNAEVFSPHKTKWKAFNDKHTYLAEKIKKFYVSGSIEDLDENYTKEKTTNG